MRTYLSLEYTHAGELPPGHDVEVRTPEPLVERFLEAYSEPGDRVVDIFAGYGTTLAVAERLDRIPYGLEYDRERVSHIQDRIATPEQVRHGDVLEMEGSWFPPCDLCYTSPPFMERTDDRNPFRNYAGQSSYDRYLEAIEAAFANLDAVLAADAYVVVDVANMKHEERVTPLAWDVAECVSTVFEFEGEVVVTWEGGGADRDGAFGYGYDHSYCHVFRNSDA